MPCRRFRVDGARHAGNCDGHRGFHWHCRRGNEIVGVHGDYLRSPHFRGGAWRVIAVQLGGLKAILQLYKERLSGSLHCDHPVQLARFGEAVIACETAHVWVRQASIVAEGPFENADLVDAYVDLARNAFESAALRVLELARKAIGLKAFMRPNPLERISRDLETYLRQPALDTSLMSAAAFHIKGSHALGVTAADFFAAAERLPFESLNDVTRCGGLLAVAPHPDDESLGVGGLIAAACALGIAVRLIVVSDGVGSHPGSKTYPEAKLRALREAETIAAASELGLHAAAIRFLRLPDRFVPTQGPDAVAACDAMVSAAHEIGAGAICVTWARDPHCDHAAGANVSDWLLHHQRLDPELVVLYVDLRSFTAGMAAFVRLKAESAVSLIRGVICRR